MEKSRVDKESRVKKRSRKKGGKIRTHAGRNKGGNIDISIEHLDNRSQNILHLKPFDD